MAKEIYLEMTKDNKTKRIDIPSDVIYTYDLYVNGSTSLKLDKIFTPEKEMLGIHNQLKDYSDYTMKCYVDGICIFEAPMEKCVLMYRIQERNFRDTVLMGEMFGVRYEQ